MGKVHMHEEGELIFRLHLQSRLHHHILRITTRVRRRYTMRQNIDKALSILKERIKGLGNTGLDIFQRRVQCVTSPTHERSTLTCYQMAVDKQIPIYRW